MNTQKEFSFQIEGVQNVAMVNCSGRMVRGAALDELRRRIEQLQAVRMLVLDVSEVEQVDAAGLGTLLVIRRWAARNGARVNLENPPVFFRRLLEITHLTGAFEISSVREALCMLAAKDSSPRYATA